MKYLYTVKTLRRMKTGFFLFFFLWYIAGFSQMTPQINDDKEQTIFETLESQETGQGKVIIEQPFTVKDIVNKQIEFNSKFIGSQGYRVQVGFFSGNKGREKAYKMKSDIITKLPDYDTYIVFLQPYFKVRIGDFFTKSQALRALQEIKEVYPSAFIVEDLIHFE